MVMGFKAILHEQQTDLAEVLKVSRISCDKRCCLLAS